MRRIIYIFSMITISIILSSCIDKLDYSSKKNKENKKEIKLEENIDKENSEKEIRKEEKIVIKNGEILDRDIIPKLSKIYNLNENEVKKSFSMAKSKLINEKIEDFRKMEGIIVPGEYILEKNIDHQRDYFINEAEKRYMEIEKKVQNKNFLSESERITLASMIESESLRGNYRQEIADVFLNRITEGSKIQSCVTAEYALGYQRPYLTFEDTEIESPYNTYFTEGLPLGPISVFSDESLEKAIGVSKDKSLKYFYYDYIMGDMSFFSDFEEFNKSGIETMNRFKEKSKVGEFEKINKQELYGK